MIIVQQTSSANTAVKKLRVVYDNAANNGTLTSPNTTATLPVANLQNDRKSRVARSTGLAWQLELVFPANTMINMVALAFTNLTGNAAMRVRGYASPSAVVDTDTPDWDVVAAPCCAAPYSARQDGIGALGANGFALGAYAHAYRWFAGGAVRKLVINVQDGSNTAGYIEAARLICGDYWTPTFNPDYGATLTFADTSKNERSDAGDLLSEIHHRYKKLTLSMTQMPAADREVIADFFQVNGLYRPLFVSLFPEDPDPVREQAYTLYGKLTQMAAITASAYNQYAWPIEIEEV